MPFRILIVLLLVLMFASVPGTLSAATDALGRYVIPADSLLGGGIRDLTPYMEYTTEPLSSIDSINDPSVVWTSVRKAMQLRGMEPVIIDEEWSGEGWFRVRFRVSDSTPSIAVKVMAHNACDVFLDGSLLASIGSFTTPNDKIPSRQIFSLDPDLDRSASDRVHTLAFHVKTGLYRYMMNDGQAVGFHAIIGDTEYLYTNRVRGLVTVLRNTLIPFGMVISLGMLHLLMYLFDRRSVVNLYYVAFALAFIGVFVTMFIAFTTDDGFWLQLANDAGTAMWSILIATALLLISMLFYGSISRVRWIATSLGAVLVIVVPFLVDGIGTVLWGSFVCIAMLDVGRLTFTAIRRGIKGAWIIGLGILPLTVFLLSWFSIVYLGWLSLPEVVWRAIYITGFISMPLSMSVFLALRITKTNRDLSTQLERVEVLSQEKIAQERRVIEEELRTQQLEADNRRKTQELDEARKLQLSMLPTNMPSTDYFRTSIAMNTATEVGGDYVDYYTHGDNHTTFALGDATGHGLKAGVMVATVKSHFQTRALTDDHHEILDHTGDGIRRLNLRGLYMCLGLLTVRGRTCQWTSAGIPPLLHFAAKTGTIRHHLVKGLPLGAPRKGDSNSLEFEVEDGDVLLLMTDGLPELFDPGRRSLGYQKIEETLARHADRTTTELIDRLVELADTWRAGRPYNDDVTLLAIKFG